MGLQGHRRTSSSKRRRAAHFALTKISLTKCTNCGVEIKPHHACVACGMYDSRTVIAPKAVKMETPVKTLRVSKKKKAADTDNDHDHDHAGHDHSHETSPAESEPVSSETSETKTA